MADEEDLDYANIEIFEFPSAANQAELRHVPTAEEIRWRMLGYLDCLNALITDGPPDHLFIEYMHSRLGEVIVRPDRLEYFYERYGRHTRYRPDHS